MAAMLVVAAVGPLRFMFTSPGELSAAHAAIGQGGSDASIQNCTACHGESDGGGVPPASACPRATSKTANA
jgi:mono/diheme cytochrome c family protein